MQYIEFGKDKDKVSEIVMGLMRIFKRCPLVRSWI